MAAGEAKFRPKVLVLVIGGLGASELAAINYDSVIPLPRAQADLDVIAAEANWTVSDAKGETKSSGGPDPAPTTSISFRARGMIGYGAGTLPIEPFVNALKRFKDIEIDYMAPASFSFRGLKDFDNRFVKIDLNQQGNSYRYRITVQDADFTKLNLPLVQPVKTKPAKTGTSKTGVILPALAMALAAALLVYLAASYLVKKGKRDES